MGREIGGGGGGRGGGRGRGENGRRGGEGEGRGDEGGRGETTRVMRIQKGKCLGKSIYNLPHSLSSEKTSCLSIDLGCEAAITILTQTALRQHKLS